MPRNAEDIGSLVKEIQAIKKQAKRAVTKFHEVHLKDLNTLQKLAWLHATHATTEQIHLATTKAREDGYSWRAIAVAKDHEDSTQGARIAMSLHKRWTERYESK